MDAWGVVRLAIGDFDCLRIRDNEVAISQLVILGTVIGSDTTTTINYTWVSKNDFQVARVSSENGETNPNFTTGFNFTRLGTRTTGVAHRPQGESIPADFGLAQNFPNPFNPVTTISYILPSSARVRLAVFDNLGREVALLADGEEPAGPRSHQWEAASFASGVYFYRLTVDGTSFTRKMLLLR